LTVLPETVSWDILKFSRRSKKLIKLVSFGFEFSLVYCYYLFFPVVLSMSIYVIMSSQYIQMRQKHVFAKFATVNRALKRVQNPQKLARFWIRYMKYNMEMVHICGQTKTYSKFWAPFLSILFPYYI